MKHSETGCRILDEAGVTQGEQLEGAGNCLSCPYDNCVLDRNNPDLELQEEYTLTEITVQCTNCFSLETLTMVDGELRASRYYQVLDKIYHKTPTGECGVCKVFK